MELRLRWDGKETLVISNGSWVPLTHLYLAEEFYEYWDQHAPEDMKGWRLPALSGLFAPGVVQIWSGFFVSTVPDWSILVRPPANLHSTSAFSCYEGLIETDRFKPCPLFINIKLHATDREILIPSHHPLFQVQPIHRSCYSQESMSFIERDGLELQTDETAGMSHVDWAGLRETTRSINIERSDAIGDYGAQSRIRGKSEPQVP